MSWVINMLIELFGNYLPHPLLSLSVLYSSSQTLAAICYTSEKCAWYELVELPASDSCFIRLRECSYPNRHSLQGQTTTEHRYLVVRSRSTSSGSQVTWDLRVLAPRWNGKLRIRDSQRQTTGDYWRSRKAIHLILPPQCPWSHVLRTCHAKIHRTQYNCLRRFPRCLSKLFEFMEH